MHDRRFFDETATDGVDMNVTYNVVDLCSETLTVLERTGGPYAYANIKYVVPTYESVEVACHVPITGRYEDGEERDYVVNIRI
jgi:hypothetical protein